MVIGTKVATRAGACKYPPRKKPARGKNAEAIVQAAIVAWLRAVGFPLAFHVPNGGLRSKSEAAKLKWMGVLAGVPDIVVPLPYGEALFMEVKADRSCALSPEQKLFRDRLHEIGGCWVCVTSIDEARMALSRYGIATREAAP